MLLRTVECWLAAVNLLAFGLCGLDKWKARRGFWRVRERTLLGTALLGGAPGLLAGMALFRHKIRHKKFVWGVPAILTVQIAAALWLLSRLAG